MFGDEVVVEFAFGGFGFGGVGGAGVSAFGHLQPPLLTGFHAGWLADPQAGGRFAQTRKEVQAARKKGVPASVLAKKYGVSTAYIYMIE